jgi:prepilin-type N-terminal cleavage/methylation domain-containing protein
MDAFAWEVGMVRGKAGVTLVELMAVLTLVGVLISLVSPAMGRVAGRARAVTALNQFTADVAYARMLAVRNGNRVELRFLDDARCGARRFGRFTAGGYRISVLEAVPRPLVERRREHLGRGVCLDSNSDRTMVINARGLLVPFENRTVWSRYGEMADSVKISVLGRVRRP